MHWFHQLPTEILQKIYDYDPTFHQHFSQIVQYDICRYQNAEMYYYIPTGIHAFLFYPRYWALETDVEVENPQNRQCTILRFFLDSPSMESYIQELPAEYTGNVAWKHVDHFMKETFAFP